MGIFSPGTKQSSYKINGLIGPYSTKGWGPGSCNPCPPPCCDLDFEFDYGTQRTIGIDWTDILSENNECKVITSKWYLNDTASTPLSFGEQKIELNTTSIMVGGGVHSGEYKVVNHITTEEGTSHRIVVCVKVIGCLTGGLIYVGDECCKKAVAHNMIPMKPCDGNLIPVETCEPIVKCRLQEGQYSLSDILQDDTCVTKLTLILIEGSAQYIDSSGNYPIDNCNGVTIENNGMCINDFIVNVSANSSIFFSKETP